MDHCTLNPALVDAEPCLGPCPTLLPPLHRLKSWDLTSLCNGVLVGFVSVTSGAAVYEPWAAILCAVMGVMVFDAMCAVSGEGGAYIGVHAVGVHP